MSTASEIFKDLKVLELASVLAGPSVGQFFAELGAQVLKVENPNTGGDVTRSWTLPGEDVEAGVSSYFACANWGKESIFTDITTAEGKEAVLNHVKEADIIISSYKPGDAEKLGLDYQTLKKENPQLIYAHVTGYGADSDRAGYDAVVQAESGFMYINGEKGSRPLKLPVALVDLLAAHQLKEGILVALLQRERTGEGALVEVSLFDAAVSSLANQATNWLVGGREPQAMGSAHPNIAPYGTVYMTKDGGEVILAIGSDRQFQLLCETLEIAEIANDDRFKTNRQRVSNRNLLDDILNSAIGKFNRDNLLGKLQELKVPAGAVKKVSEALEVAEEAGMLMQNNQIKGVRQVAFKLNGQRNPHLTPPQSVS